MPPALYVVTFRNVTDSLIIRVGEPLETWKICRKQLVRTRTRTKKHPQHITHQCHRFTWERAAAGINYYGRMVPFRKIFGPTKEEREPDTEVHPGEWCLYETRDRARRGLYSPRTRLMPCPTVLPTGRLIYNSTKRLTLSHIPLRNRYLSRHNRLGSLARNFTRPPGTTK